MSGRVSLPEPYDPSKFGPDGSFCLSSLVLAAEVVHKRCHVDECPICVEHIERYDSSLSAIPEENEEGRCPCGFGCPHYHYDAEGFLESDKPCHKECKYQAYYFCSSEESDDVLYENYEEDYDESSHFWQLVYGSIGIIVLANGEYVTFFDDPMALAEVMRREDERVIYDAHIESCKNLQYTCYTAVRTAESVFENYSYASKGRFVKRLTYIPADVPPMTDEMYSDQHLNELFHTYNKIIAKSLSDIGHMTDMTTAWRRDDMARN